MQRWLLFAAPRVDRRRFAVARGVCGSAKKSTLKTLRHHIFPTRTSFTEFVCTVFFIMHSQTFAGTTSHSNEVIDTSFGPNSPPQPCLPHVITEHLRSKESSRKQVKNKNTENRDSCRWFSYSVNKYAIEVSSWRRSLSRLRENIVVHINTHKPNMYACRLSLMVVGARNFLLQVNCAITAGTDREQKINIQINTFSSMLLKVVRLLATHVKLWQLAKDTANATAID